MAISRSSSSWSLYFSLIFFIFPFFPLTWSDFLASSSTFQAGAEQIHGDDDDSNVLIDGDKEALNEGDNEVLDDGVNEVLDDLGNLIYLIYIM